LAAMSRAEARVHVIVECERPFVTLIARSFIAISSLAFDSTVTAVVYGPPCECCSEPSRFYGE